MAWLYTLIGVLVGAYVGGVVTDSYGGLGALIGGVFALLTARINGLNTRLRALEAQVARQASTERVSALRETARAATERAVEPAPQPARTPPPVAPAPLPEFAPVPTPVAPPAPEVALPSFPDLEPIAAAITPPPQPASPAAAAARSATPARSASPVDAADTGQATRIAHDVYQTRPPREIPPHPVALLLKRWFTEGNVPVKIGVLVLFLGVGALIKYAADQGWLRMPMEYRLAGIAAGALALLVFAWTKRESHRTFSLSAQGGMIGVLILDIFGAYRKFELLPSGLAFGLILALVVATGVLAVLQDALALAVFGVVGGFLAPILTASNSGNHVALFSYYALLNLAILGVALARSWRVLNLVGFAFTFGVGTVWGTLKYRPELFDSTEPFLAVFYLIYLAVPLVFAWRQPQERRGFVDGTLVFGLPLFAFPLQVVLLDGDRMQLALSAFVLAVAYVGLGWFTLRRLKLQLLGESYVLLALGFATLAVPLALSARGTSCTWAIEGAALVWLGLRQQRQVPRWIGAGLQLAAGMAYFASVPGLPPADGTLAVLNGEFLAGALILLAGFTTSRLLLAHEPDGAGTHVAFAWGLFWWIVVGVDEIQRYVGIDQQANATLAWIALTALLSGEIARRFDWGDFRWPALAGVLLGPFLILPTYAANHGPLEGLGAAAWLAYAAASWRTQVNLARTSAPLLPFVYFVHVWTYVLLFAVELYSATGAHAQLNELWRSLAGLAPLALAFAGLLKRWRVLRLPLEEHADALRTHLMGSLAIVLGLAWFVALFAEGVPAPLPYLPVLNPLELASLTYVLLLGAWYAQAEAEGTAYFDRKQRGTLLALASFALLTSMVLRGVHFLGDVPWSHRMFSSALAQAAMSIAWSIAGVITILIGHRRASRPVWIAGAALFGLVIVKLVLVDWHHLNDLSAILALFALGGLLFVVGYFAPAPPSEAKPAQGDSA